MLPTPSTSHVCYDQVYEPAEDSYLLLDTLASDPESTFLKHRFGSCAAPLVCEVGTGSGIVLAFVTANAQAIFGRNDILTMGTDINIFACKAAEETVNRAMVESTMQTVADTKPPAPQSGTSFVGVVNADLVSPLRRGKVDVLIFNPPYVPADLPDLAGHGAFNVLAPDLAPSSQQAFERDSHLLALSYAGGDLGMEITNRLLDQIPEVLSSETGVAYVLLCAQNKPADVAARVHEWSGGWSASIVGRSGKQAGWEKLVILRICRTSSDG